MSVLEVDVSRKAYRTPGGAPLLVHEALRFHVARGELACLVGPSGCGKSSLLDLIAGLDSDYSGTIRVSDLEPGAGPAVGYVFQSPRLMPWLTVFENVRLVLARHDDARVARVLQEVGLGEAMHVYPGRLSGGMRRRVALARALVDDPPLLLLDEPFLSLDAPAAERLRALVLDLWAVRSTTALVVTHDLREALAMADRILFLSARPARVVLDLPVALERSRRADPVAVERLRARVLAEHPLILQGLRLADGGAGEDTGCAPDAAREDDSPRDR